MADPNDLADRLDDNAPHVDPCPHHCGDCALMHAAAAVLRQQADQLDTLHNAIAPALGALRGWDMLGPGGTSDREWALGQLDRIADALAAAGGGVPEEGATDE